MVLPVDMTAPYVSWTQVPSTDGKGRKSIRYYLKRKDGVEDLAVIGKERSSKRMCYRFVLKSHRSVQCKLKSHQEVVDWLVSFSPGSMDHGGRDFMWIGSARKGSNDRKHYQSFLRQYVRISVNDFVCVLSEEGKQLVAHLQDMYEDSRGSKMVTVQWFHKINEVGLFLPHNYNDREILFSLCRQDLNVECIDGLATILSPQHYETYVKATKQTQEQAFVCRKLFHDVDNVKPFDITRLEGYWNQEVVRYMFNVPTSQQHILHPTVEGSCSQDYSLGVGMKKGCSEEDDHSPKGCISKVGAPSVDDKLYSRKRISDHTIDVGCRIEVLSQDSGLRGCWFRALIVKFKKHKIMMKVQYQDLQDAEVTSKNLEEWVLVDRVANTDPFGLRVVGRKTIRPPPPFSGIGTVQSDVDIGTVLDAWWHNGWWEGIVVQKESHTKFRVYFPGEKQDSVFDLVDLRYSQEWLGNRWMHVPARPDLAIQVARTSSEKVEPARPDLAIQVARASSVKVERSVQVAVTSNSGKSSDSESKACDLLKGGLLSLSSWKTSKKRRRVRSARKAYSNGSSDGMSVVLPSSSNCKRLYAPASLEVDCEKRKGTGILC